MCGTISQPVPALVKELWTYLVTNSLDNATVTLRSVARSVTHVRLASLTTLNVRSVIVTQPARNPRSATRRQDNVFVKTIIQGSGVISVRQDSTYTLSAPVCGLLS